MRLSNVYGRGSASHNFLASLLHDALADGELCLRMSLDSWKDYVSIDDVVRMLPAIALEGTRPVYNLASGVNVSHGDVTARIAALTGCRCPVVDGAPDSRPPVIDIGRAARRVRLPACRRARRPACDPVDAPGAVSR